MSQLVNEILFINSAYGLLLGNGRAWGCWFRCMFYFPESANPFSGRTQAEDRQNNLGQNNAETMGVFFATDSRGSVQMWNKESRKAIFNR